MTAAAGVARDASLEHLLGRLEVLGARVESAVARRRANDADPDDRFRGLYLSEAHVDELLQRRLSSIEVDAFDESSEEVERSADADEAGGQTLRLRRLAAEFALDLTDVDLLMVALAPDLDPRFERLYGYLHDDVTRRRASVGLALELCGISAASAEGRRRLGGASSALIAAGLIVVDDRDRPVLTRALRVPDRVSAHLLGDPALDPAVSELLLDLPGTAARRWEQLDNALAMSVSPVYLRELAGTSAAWIAASAAYRQGSGSLVIDAARLARSAEPRDSAAVLVREARLLRRILVAANVDVIVDRPDVLAVLTDEPVPIILTGTRPWDPAWSRSVPLTLETPNSSSAERHEQWVGALNGHGNDADLLRATLAFRLTPSQIARAAVATELAARVNDRPAAPADLQAASRAQNAAGLDRLAHRIEPHTSWQQLVLPDEVRAQLRELSARARQRERVLDEWGVGGRALRGRGITALFAGDSGTGKTLSAEVIAADLGLDLYVIDLATVVDKYIGETEKNLDRIFAEADRVNGVLLFDEADAIFGKRSEVRDARDRYANVEVAYLLQRMERFDGLAVLTTNLRANLDEAFTRRIDVIVDFPMPEEDDRLALWQLHLPSTIPQADDLDQRFLADRFRFSGGNIRNICVTAAFFAAEADQPLSMADLIRATEREYRKLGRLTVESEFGPYMSLARP